MDVALNWTGSLILLNPMSERGMAWLADNLEDGAAWVAGGFACEPRYAVDIVQAMEADGLAIDKL